MCFCAFAFASNNQLIMALSRLLFSHSRLLHRSRVLSRTGVRWVESTVQNTTKDVLKKSVPTALKDDEHLSKFALNGSKFQDITIGVPKEIVRPSLPTLPSFAHLQHHLQHRHHHHSNFLCHSIPMRSVSVKVPPQWLLS